MVDCLITRRTRVEGRVSHSHVLFPGTRLQVLNWSGGTKGYLQFGGEALGGNGVTRQRVAMAPASQSGSEHVVSNRNKPELKSINRKVHTSLKIQ